MLIAVIVACGSVGAHRSTTTSVEAVSTDSVWDSECDDVVAGGARRRALQTTECVANRYEDCAVRALVPSHCLRAIPEEPRWVLVPGSEASLADGLREKAEMNFWLALGGGQTTPMPTTVSYNAIGFISNDDEDVRVVFEERRSSIGVLLSSPDGRFLAATHHIDIASGEEGSPNYLSSPWISVVELESLSVFTFAVPTVVEPMLGAQSVSVSWQGENLYVLTRDVRSGGERRQAVQCNAANRTCAPARVDAIDRDSVYAVATANGGYLVTPVPLGVVLPEEAERRSVRFSPNGRRFVWVFEEVIAGDGEVERVLLLHSAEGDVEIARGRSSFDARWLDDDNVLFDAEPTATDIGRFWRDATNRNVARRVRSRTASTDWSTPVGQPLIERTRRVELARAWRETADALPVGTGPAYFQHEHLSVYTLSTGETRRYVSIGHVRLFAQPRRPNVHGGRVLDVPYLFDPASSFSETMEH